MKPFFDMLAKGRYQGIALFSIIVFSGIGKKFIENVFSIAERLDNRFVELSVGIFVILLGSCMLSVMVLAMIVILLKDADIDIVPDKWKVKDASKESQRRISSRKSTDSPQNKSKGRKAKRRSSN